MTAGPRIAVLDYGIGNLRSAQKALEHVGARAELTSDASVAATQAPAASAHGDGREGAEDEEFATLLA